VTKLTLLSCASHQVVEARPDSIAKVYALFPTISHLSDSPNGRRLQPLFRPSVSYILALLSALLLSWLPLQVLSPLIRRIYGMPQGKGALVTAGLVSSPWTILAVLALAREEMIQIAKLDEGFLDTHGSKFTFYWGQGASDGWVRESTIDEIVAAAKGARAVRCDQGMPHDFCISHGKAMANKCIGWLKDDFRDEY
jgi:hypothetical protein